MEPSIRLAQWIRDRYPYSHLEPMTHLKLQKLLFYCVGTALAFNGDSGLGCRILFQPWQHGPVNRDVWLEFKEYKGREIQQDCCSAASSYPEDVEKPMMWAIQIYGALDAWRLRQQSHLETPWIEAFQSRNQYIQPDAIRRHFEKKFRGATVQAPEYLQDPGTFTVDYIPVIRYSSMAELASSISAIYM